MTPASWVENSPPDLSQGSGSKTLICDPTMKYKFQLGRTFSKLGGYLEFVLNWTQWSGWFGLTETRILNSKEAARKYKVSGNRQVFRLLIEIFQGFGRILMVIGFLSEILVGLHIEPSSYEKILLLLKSWVVSLEPVLQEKKIFHSSIMEIMNYFSVSGQSLSRVWLFATPWTVARQASLSITNSRSPPKPMSIKLVMPSNHLILCRPLLLLPSIPPSIGVFSNESALRIRWPKYWSFSFSISPSKEHPGLISFRMDWLDLLAVQGTLKSLFHHHTSKASILWRSAFFIAQLSYPFMTTGKTIALTRRTLGGKVMSLLLNILSRLVIIFLPRSKRLLISWLQSPSAVI